MTRNSTRDSRTTYIPSFLVGLGVGAALGILFAPRSGEDTRDLVTEKVRTGLDQARNKGRELGRRAQQAYLREKELISEAMEVGKQAYHEEKSKPF